MRPLDLTDEVDRVLVVASDIEMGAGGPMDDFPHSDWLGELVLSYDQPPYDTRRVELVLNGDVFDLLKTPYLGGHPHYIDQDVALGKMSAVAAAHPRFFEAVRQFLAFRDERVVHFVVGNHDAEVLFPAVQQLLLALCGGDAERVRFPGFTLDLGEVHVEHGHQADPMFRIDRERAFVTGPDGTELLALSWAAVALLEVAMPMKPLLYAYDRLVPRKRVFELVPEIKEVVVAAFWKYWSRDFPRAYFRRTDPMKKVSWTMVKEVARQFGSPNPDVSMGRYFEDALRATGPHRLVCVGHQHQQRVWSRGNRKVVQTGCLRNEFMLEDDGERFEPIPKSYVEVHMAGDRLVRSHLLEVSGPPTPAGFMPDSIYDVVPKLRELLDAEADLPQLSEERRAQEAREAEQA